MLEQIKVNIPQKYLQSMFIAELFIMVEIWNQGLKRWLNS